jgi:hypothetical protein
MGKILQDAASVLDLGQPVAVLFIGVLHIVADSEDPSGLIATAMAAWPPAHPAASCRLPSPPRSSTRTLSPKSPAGTTSR